MIDRFAWTVSFISSISSTTQSEARSGVTSPSIQRFRVIVRRWCVLQDICERLGIVSLVPVFWYWRAVTGWYEAERRHKIPENRGAVRKAITSTEIGSCVLVCRSSFEFRFVSLHLSPFLSLYSSFVPLRPFSHPRWLNFLFLEKTRSSGFTYCYKIFLFLSPSGSALILPAVCENFSIRLSENALSHCPRKYKKCID